MYAVRMTTQRLTSRQAADLLGVKIETIYAYTSRGLLTSERRPGGRGSTFDAAQVRALAQGRSAPGRVRPQPAHPGPAHPDPAHPDPAHPDLVHPDPAHHPDPDRSAPLVLHSGITLIADGRLFYRGADAVELADRYRFEQVAALLWEVAAGSGVEFEISAELFGALRRAGA